jgi:hypothetical protein
MIAALLSSRAPAHRSFTMNVEALACEKWRSRISGVDSRENPVLARRG